MAVIKFNKKNRAILIGRQPAKGALVPNSTRATIDFSGTGANTDTVIVDGVTATLSGAVTAANLVLAFLGNSIANVVISGTNTAYQFKSSSIATQLKLVAKPNTIISAAPAVTGTSSITSVVNWNSLVATSMVAAETLASDVQLKTGSFTYLGDALSRAEYTYTQDQFGNPVLETPEQCLGTFTPTTLNTPFTSTFGIGAGTLLLFQASGGYVTIQTAATGTLFPHGYVNIDNSRKSDYYLTGDIRYSSPEDPNGYDKIFTYYDLISSVDISASLTTIPKLKFNLSGNLEFPWTGTVDAKKYTQKAAGISADFGNQMLNVAEPILPNTIKVAQIIPLADTYTNTWGGTITPTFVANVLKLSSTVAHGITVGNIHTISFTSNTGDVNASIYDGVHVALAISTTEVLITLKNTPTAIPDAGFVAKVADTAAKSISFGNFTANNFFGFNLARYTTSEEQGFNKTAQATDVSVTILEDQAFTTNFDPDINISNYFALQIRFGTADYKYVTRIWESLQIANTKEADIEGFNGREITFRNTGISRIIYS